MRPFLCLRLASSYESGAVTPDPACLLLVRVRRGVMLSGFRRVMYGVRVVAVRHEGVVARFLVISRLMLLCRFAMVPGRMLVVFGRTSMVLGPVVSCHNRLLEWDA